MYYFDVRESYARLLERCRTFLQRYGAQHQPCTPNHARHACEKCFQAEELVRTWFEYHLIRTNYLELPFTNSFWSRHTEFHNEILLGSLREEHLLYAKINSVALEHRHNRAQCALTKRDLILTFDLRH